MYINKRLSNKNKFLERKSQFYIPDGFPEDRFLFTKICFFFFYLLKTSLTLASIDRELFTIMEMYTELTT